MDIDGALRHLSELPLEEFDAFEPKTVSEKLAMKLISNALSDESINGLKVVLERLEGRATIKEREAGGQNELLDLLKQMRDS